MNGESGESRASVAQSWQRSKWENPLYGKPYDQFVLYGRYLRPPAVVGPETPRLIVHCDGGKFASGEFCQAFRSIS
jgi:hypothetical protein